MLSKFGQGSRLLAACAHCQRNLSTVSRGHSGLYWTRPKRCQAYMSFVPTLSSYRSISSEASINLPTAEGTTTSGFLPPPPEAVALPEELTLLGEPTLSSLGLGGYWPSGLVQNMLESIHVYCDFPWYSSVIALTLIIRTLTIPVTVMQLKNAANMNNNMPTMMKFQQQLKEVQMSRDYGRLEKLSAEMSEYTVRNDCSPLKMLFRPLISAPIFISIFYGLRGIADLPVESFKTGGAAWFTDLTIADPYFLLPAFSALTVAAVTMTGVEGVSLGGMPKHINIMMKVMPVVIFAFTSFQPAVLALYWTTSNIVSLVFGRLLRTKHGRTLFNIPDMIQHPPLEMPDLFTTSSQSNLAQQTSEYSRLAQLQHEMNERRQLGELKFKKKETPESESEGISDDEQEKSTGSRKYDPTNVRSTSKAKRT